MGDLIVDGLILAGVLAMIAVPILACALARMCARVRGLEDRNAAQAAMIYRLEWPMGVGEAPERGR